MSLQSQVRIEIRRVTDESLSEIRSLVEAEYQRRLEREINNKQVVGGQ